MKAISIVIGATLQSSFNSTMAGSTKQLSRIGSTIKQLESSSKSVSKFKELSHDALLARRSWNELEIKTKSLAQQIKNAEEPSKSLQNEFTRSKTAALKAKTAYLQKRSALRLLRTEFSKSGRDIKSLIGDQAKLGSSIEKLKNNYMALNSVMQKRKGVLAQRVNFKAQMIDAVTLGLTLAAPLKAAISFESAMADVKKVVKFEDKDVNGLTKLGETLKAMSRTIPLSAAELAQITASGGQLGIAAKDLAIFTDTVAKMATAFDMSAEEAGEAIAKLSNIYQIEIGEMANIGDAINHISDNTAAKAKEIVPTLNRIGGTARQFGLTAVEAGALASSFISLGKAPEKAGTAINAMLSKLQTASKQGGNFQKAFQVLKINAQEFEKAIGKNAQGTLLKFLETVAKLDKQERSSVLFDLFGLEYQDDIALLTGSLDEYRKSLRLINEEYHGSMQREFENRANTKANNLQLLKNSIAEVGMNLGYVLLPPLNFTVNLLRSATTQVALYAKEYRVLTTVIMSTTTALISIKIAAISLGYAWTFVKGSLFALLSTWRMFGSVITLVKIGLSAVFPAIIAGFKALTIALMSNPMGLVIGGFAVAATLMIIKWQAVKDFFITIWESVKVVWKSFSDWIGKFWNNITQPFKTINNLWSKKNEARLEVRSVNNVISDSLKHPITAQNKTIENKMQFSINIHSSPGQNARSIADEVMERIREQFSGALYDIN
ncbi:phage tail tape measure protein [Wolbachia endosymbiont (group B) of Camptogramma bilineatum]|uniref:phage tail tape measure protein n=1 Tax=Wolbachia endosymbiont (group B) of Camptogramma bilineatum TaxID=2953991 RepID=UPI002232AB90|nr:phage tail tape measure protein [Wolbachia endosymbiont (group B) of Camptogramma bilineatum]